jgi:hypothetical protein
MSNRALRIVLVLMAATPLGMGAWALAAPRSFFDVFPGGGRHWVSADGPYNEHLMRDFGGLNLGLAIVAVIAAITLSRPTVIAAALAALAFAVPHLTYHLFHLDLYDTSDQVANVVALGGAVVLPIAALVLAARLAPDPTP